MSLKSLNDPKTLPSIVKNLVGGTPEEQLLGMCETVWEPGMKPDELFECISQVNKHI